MPPVDTGPTARAPPHFVEQRLAPDINKVSHVVSVIEHKVAPRLVLNNAAVARTFPRLVAAQNRIAGILLPRSEQSARARDAHRVVTLAPAAGVAGIEQIKVIAVAQDERPFDQIALPRRGVADQLFALADEPRAVG